MRNNYKKMLRELLASKGLVNVSFGSLPDRKSVYTNKSGFGFYGSLSAKTWRTSRKEYKQ